MSNKRTDKERVLDTALCPLCGKPNQCVMAAGATADTPCWCREAQFPEALLASVPAKAKHKACICADCVARWQQADG